MDLLQFLKKDKNTRKIFGVGELKIIEKQLLGINLTQSEKNRLSRDIRKKFEFIKEISKFEYDFELKKGSKIKEKVERAKEVILNSEYFPKIKQILLFGSSVKNQVTFRSDIDIAVEFDKIDITEATKFRVYVAGRVSDKIDIQVFNILPEKIQNSILKDHKILYRK
jgi:predicted nucleotidyltransferase